MPATAAARNAAVIAARAAAELKAENIIAVDVSEKLALTEVFLIISATNERQVRSLVDKVDEALLQAGFKRRMREGFAQARWVLVDYGDLVVHIQQSADREFYALEKLWGDCPQLELELAPLTSQDACSA